MRAAQTSFDGEQWNATAINAIHCCICATDAICVYFLGKRHSVEKHNDAAVLMKSIKASKVYNENANRLVRILNIKNKAE